MFKRFTDAIKRGISSAWRTAKLGYQIVAFVGLVAWGIVLFGGTHSGYAQLTLPIGTAFAQADGEQMSKAQAEFKAQDDKAKAEAQKKVEKHADASPRPGRNPFIPAPPTPAQGQ